MGECHILDRGEDGPLPPPGPRRRLRQELSGQTRRQLSGCPGAISSPLPDFVRGRREGRRPRFLPALPRPRRPPLWPHGGRLPGGKRPAAARTATPGGAPSLWPRCRAGGGAGARVAMAALYPASSARLGRGCLGPASWRSRDPFPGTPSSRR